MAMGIDELIEEIKALPPEQQQRVRDTLGDATPPRQIRDDATAEEEFKLRLLEAGLIQEIKRPEHHLQELQEAFLSYQPITIRGKPLSETIIEERR
ncbi:MAG: hypothetical protein WD851_24760 [Pirellulales bacterium]